MLRLDILGVQAFVFIAELGNFSSAAEHLHLSQTALSRRVSKLEESIGVELLVRTTRSVSLSQAGRDFLPRARRIVRELASALDDMKDNAAKGYGRFVVACLPTVAAALLPPVLAEYRRRHPRNRIHILDRSAYEIREAVLQGEADFGISVPGSLHSDLEYQPLFDDPVVAVCPNGHPLGRRRRLAWKELEGIPLVGASALSGLRLQLEQVVHEHKLDLFFAYEVSHLATITGMVLGGAGLAVLPQTAVRMLSAGELKILPLHTPRVVRSIQIFRRADRPLSTLSRPLYDLALAHLAAGRRQPASQ